MGWHTHLIDYCTSWAAAATTALRIAVDGSGRSLCHRLDHVGELSRQRIFAIGVGRAKNAFVTRLNPAGVLVYSSYLGGNGSDTRQRHSLLTMPATITVVAIHSQPISLGRIRFSPD